MDEVSRQLIEARVAHVIGEDIRRDPWRFTYRVFRGKNGRYKLVLYLDDQFKGSMGIGTPENTSVRLNDEQWKLVVELALDEPD